MRSTTVGRLTSMLRDRPVTADHTWLSQAGPQLRDSASHAIEPTNATPRTSPRMSASSGVDRAGFGDRRPASELPGISQDYHRAGGQSRPPLPLAASDFALEFDFETETSDVRIEAEIAASLKPRPASTS